jgi:hypothetical protein
MVALRALLCLSLLACASSHQGISVATVPPRPDDVATVDGMMKAFYAVVNVAPDEPRGWARDRTLYSPWMRFVAIGKKVELLTHQQYVEETEPLIKAGFQEVEIKRTTRRYGNIVHVDSTYETLFGPQKQKSRGVNSIEMYWDGTRWWIVSVVWQSETPEFPLPPELLP